MLDAYMDAIRKAEGENLKFYKLNQDGDIFDENGQLTLSGNPKGMTIMLICQIPETAREYMHYMDTRTKISIGQIIILESSMLKIDGKVPLHNFWFFKFCSMFEAEIETVRFTEMRPKRL